MRYKYIVSFLEVDPASLLTPCTTCHWVQKGMFMAYDSMDAVVKAGIEDEIVKVEGKEDGATIMVQEERSEKDINFVYWYKIKSGRPPDITPESWADTQERLKDYKIHKAETFVDDDGVEWVSLGKMPQFTSIHDSDLALFCNTYRTKHESAMVRAERLTPENFNQIANYVHQHWPLLNIELDFLSEEGTTMKISHPSEPDKVQTAFVGDWIVDDQLREIVVFSDLSFKREHE